MFLKIFDQTNLAKYKVEFSDIDALFQVSECERLLIIVMQLNCYLVDCFWNMFDIDKQTSESIDVVGQHHCNESTKHSDTERRIRLQFLEKNSPIRIHIDFFEFTQCGHFELKNRIQK